MGGGCSLRKVDSVKSNASEDSLQKSQQQQQQQQQQQRQHSPAASTNTSFAWTAAAANTSSASFGTSDKDKEISIPVPAGEIEAVLQPRSLSPELSVPRPSSAASIRSAANGGAVSPAFLMQSSPSNPQLPYTHGGFGAFDKQPTPLVSPRRDFAAPILEANNLPEFLEAGDVSKLAGEHDLTSLAMNTPQFNQQAVALLHSFFMSHIARSHNVHTGHLRGPTQPGVEIPRNGHEKLHDSMMSIPPMNPSPPPPHTHPTQSLMGSHQSVLSHFNHAFSALEPGSAQPTTRRSSLAVGADSSLPPGLDESMFFLANKPRRATAASDKGAAGGGGANGANGAGGGGGGTSVHGASTTSVHPKAVAVA